MSASLCTAIREAMQPLVHKFGLRIIGESDLPNWTEVNYANATTGLSVAVDWSEFRPFVRICELTDDKFPLELGLIKNAQHPTIFDVDDLLLIRVDGASPVGKMLGIRSDQAVGRLLREYASVLEVHAADVLSGDFTIFAELSRIVKLRIKEMQSRAR